MRIRQSDLASFSRCAQQKKLRDDQRAGILLKPAEQLSRTAYGSVIHHALHAMEMGRLQGHPDPLGQAKATFDYYWNPEHISAICDPVTIWAARDTWSGMQRKAMAVLELYWEYLQGDKSKVLGLEVSFTLPYVLDGETHEIHGTMDRLSLRKGSVPFLNIEDYKSGKDYVKLRWNLQFTIYSWATVQPAFWEQGMWAGQGLYDRFRMLPRRGTWISVRSGVRRSDAGFRGPQDFARMDAALRQYVKAVRAEVYPLSIVGEVCEYCPFREGICGGVPVPAENYGREITR